MSLVRRALLRWSRPSRLTAGGLVAFALLLQVLFAAPLAIRMAAAASLTGDVVTSCAPVAQVNDPHPGHHQLPPHHHEQCPLCSSHAVPVALPMGKPPLPPLATAWLFLRPPPTAPPGRSLRFTSYLSRAPPAAA